MDLTNTEKALKSFSDYVIQQSKTRLTKKDRNYTSELYNSLKYDFEKADDGFIIDFKSTTETELKVLFSELSMETGCIFHHFNFIICWLCRRK